METIRTEAVVTDGRIVVDVPDAEGVRVEVTASAIPEEDVEIALEDLRRLRASGPARIYSPEPLKAWIAEGRP